MLKKMILTSAFLATTVPAFAATTVSKTYQLPFQAGCHAAKYHFKAEYPSAKNISCVDAGGFNWSSIRNYRVTGTI